MGRSFFCVPPSAANRAALSRAMSASRPIRTSAVFSRTPVNSEARDRIESSMLRVVLIHISVHQLYALIKVRPRFEIGGDDELRRKAPRSRKQGKANGGRRSQTVAASPGVLLESLDQ